MSALWARTVCDPLFALTNRQLESCSLSPCRGVGCHMKRGNPGFVPNDSRSDVCLELDRRKTTGLLNVVVASGCCYCGAMPGRRSLDLNPKATAQAPVPPNRFSKTSPRQNLHTSNFQAVFLGSQQTCYHLESQTPTGLGLQLLVVPSFRMST